VDSAYNGASDVVDVSGEDWLGGEAEGDVDDDKGNSAVRRSSDYVIEVDRNGRA
jgi:hypothetical protein